MVFHRHLELQLAKTRFCFLKLDLYGYDIFILQSRFSPFYVPAIFNIGVLQFTMHKQSLHYSILLLLYNSFYGCAKHFANFDTVFLYYTANFISSQFWHILVTKPTQQTPRSTRVGELRACGGISGDSRDPEIKVAKFILINRAICTLALCETSAPSK